ncbi:acyltransferase family protein [Noviherbaspirillum galbum]|uniref:Acyltransferase family protein n=1 Tax=Noviherbaspirillum galbum TaxID=2709383 RepID=A0A6B3SZF7_9BURK|nr:acyltransferase family protein [Noviherbaspirillum galbum]NEX64039.1 acyltransferase family protein [Noviherbaspirillum galbum]
MVTGARQQPHGKPAERRIDWVDHAKGICIVAVVMLYAAHHVQEITQDIGWMQHVVDFAKPFRMPDFFLLSGLFAARVLDRPWKSYLDTKVLHFAYFYAIWVTIKFFFMHGTAVFGPHAASLIPDYLFLFIQPPTGPLWFIYILSLFFIAVRLIRRWPPQLAVAIGAALQMLDLDTGAVLLDKFAHYFIFFYAGYRLADLVFEFADWARLHKRAALGLLWTWFITNALLVRFDLALLPGISLLTGFAGAFAVLLAASLLADLEWMRWLSRLGKHSIVVYLGFVVPLALMRPFVARVSAVAGTGTTTLAVTLLCVAGAVLLYLAVRPTPLRYLFVRPRWMAMGRTMPAVAQKAH